MAGSVAGARILAALPARPGTKRRIGPFAVELGPVSTPPDACLVAEAPVTNRLSRARGSTPLRLPGRSPLTIMAGLKALWLHD